jgi:uncharacterized protein (TIGR00255 family)
MPVYSMTGYAARPARPKRHSNAASVTVELRSVNGRFLDIGFRLPDEMRSLEPACASWSVPPFRRGKIELRMASQREVDESWPQPTDEQLTRLGALDALVRAGCPARELSVNEVLHWCRSGGGTEKLDDTALEATRRCITGLREARAREGERLVTMLLERITPGCANWPARPSRWCRR